MTPHHLSKLTEFIEARLLANTNGVGKLDKRTPTEEELAAKYGVDVWFVNRALADGVKVELEHTSDPAVAREIALDHLGEKLTYYDQLETIEQESSYELGYQRGAAASRARAGTRGADWHASANNLEGQQREDFIDGFNQALLDNEEPEEEQD